MDPYDDSQATQEATQTALDPRRFGKQNSGFSDDDISDIICLLYPNSDSASREVDRIASSSEYNHHTTARYTADAIDSDLYREDDAKNFGRNRGMGDHALVIKLSSTLKDPRLGFTFGRNRTRCDLCFEYDPGKRLSNIHFRIFVNRHGTVMLEDQSTNGTVVDGKLLRRRSDPQKASQNGATKRILESGSTIKIVMHQSTNDLVFFVRIPRRDDNHEVAYKRKLFDYLQRAAGQEDVNKTIGPGPGGHVNLFPPPRNGRWDTPNPAEVTQGSSLSSERLPREWRGSDKYARVGVIGKGAFATVHKVTSKFDGAPYAAKELDKRKFMKNGVLDQKVENEMKIMQKVHHKNIVQYIEHFDWDLHEFFIIMEYVPGGDLGKFVQEHGAIKEPYVKIMAEQLLDALDYLHQNKITHRDVKPDNILIQSTSPLVVKLTDFGLSKMIDTEQTFLKTFCGTLLYCAPEVYSEYSSYDDNGRRTQRYNHRHVDRERYDHAVDIWSLGGVLFYALTRSPPFPVKNGVSYMALLDHIIKHSLDTSPLSAVGTSDYGIHFLTRMIHVRPETRASISELQSHPWMGGRPSSDDKDLGQRASQLSLEDREARIDDFGASLLEPEPDYSADFESEKENFALGQLQPNRLFGEVNNSSIGSSGIIGEDNLNLPVSDSSLTETGIQKTEVVDSFGELEDFSTPRQNGHPNQKPVPATGNNSEVSLPSVVLRKHSPSPGGASSVLGNLNVKSLYNGEKKLQSKNSDLNTSKRKPAYDTSDEYETGGAPIKPSFKRLKSQGDLGNDDVGQDETELLASVPQVVKNQSGRLIDYPVSKMTYWDSSNRDTWHLNYPEMTNLQHNAFAQAAKKRNEEFGPGKSRLWDLAMKYFPPTRNRQPPRQTGRVLALRPALLKHESGLVSQARGQSIPREASPATEDESDSIPDTLPPETQSQQPAHAILSPNTVAEFYSTEESLVQGISIELSDPLISWGRDPSNTVVYEPTLESMVPKNAFRVIVWKDGYNADSKGFRPWDSPDSESYAFYISTKATNGIRINNFLLQANEPKSSTAACKNWIRLHDGDSIIFWGSNGVHGKAELTFRCYWGGSAVGRPAGEPPAYVPGPQARRLDRLWPKALMTLHHDKIKAEAQRDDEARRQQISKELERSRFFEEKRAEAVRVLGSYVPVPRRSSRASAPPTAVRTIYPQFRLNLASPLPHSS
ncbi:hypothetical protein M426DRAFT_322142 [Hypoxylon sp. CI-4A]|nr:hypothetical protein M426DRAFT_322142 [Hypoxylon sp. CI-4A]